MSITRKLVLICLGALTAVLMSSQLLLGLQILWGKDSPNIVRLITRHQHSGYATVAVALVYVLLSLSAIAALPTSRKNP